MPISRLVPVIVAVSLSACVRVDVGKHVAASDYTGDPKRVAVLMPSDENFGAGFAREFSDTFKAGMQSQLGACHVDVLIYQVDGMELDGPAKAQAALSRFKPDALLVVQHTQRNLYNGDERGETYLLTLNDPGQHRDVWKATVGVGAAASLLTDRSHTGGDVAAKIVRQMADDRVLKSCPAAAATAT